MEKTAIILAGGTGQRAGGCIPKQFKIIAGYPALWWPINSFIKEDPNTKIIISVHSEYLDNLKQLWKQLPQEYRYEHITVVGGATRWHSVWNALQLIEPNDDMYIAIHDGARALVTPEVIRRGWECAATKQAAVPVIPVTDSLRHISPDGNTEAVTRKDFLVVQTPQVFDSKIIVNAYRRSARGQDISSFTDDASVVERFGIIPTTYNGDSENFKITYPNDFKMAEIILSQR